MANRIEDILFRNRNGFTQDVIRLMTNSEEGLEFFRSYIADVGEGDPAEALKKQFLTCFAEQVGEWPWIVMQFLGRAICEEVDWKAVLVEIQPKYHGNN
jgi:hypothetical protein